MHAHNVPEVTVTALRRKVVIKFISSFRGRGNFWQSRHFVRECVCVWVCVRVWVYVCVCLPPAVERSETVCGPLLDSSQFSKKICLWLQGKSGARTGICGVDGTLTFDFLKIKHRQSDIFFFFLREKTELCVWVVLWEVWGRGSAFFFLSPFFPLIRIPALMAGVDFGSHEWRSRFYC